MVRRHVPPQSNGDILTLREAADFLKLSERTVWEMIQNEHLPARKLGAQWRLSRSQLMAHIEGSARPTAQG